MQEKPLTQWAPAPQAGGAHPPDVASGSQPSIGVQLKAETPSQRAQPEGYCISTAPLQL